MPVPVRCPRCPATAVMSEAMLGRAGHCPNCGVRFVYRSPVGMLLATPSAPPPVPAKPALARRPRAVVEEEPGNDKPERPRKKRTRGRGPVRGMLIAAAVLAPLLLIVFGTL